MKQVLLALAIIAATIFLATRPQPVNERARHVIELDCARLYGPLGPTAERDCQIEMLWQRGLTTRGAPG